MYYSTVLNNTYVYSLFPVSRLAASPVLRRSVTFPASASVAEVMATLDTPNKGRTTHSITVTCIYDICVDGGANMCRVMAMAIGRTTRTGE